MAIMAPVVNITQEIFISALSWLIKIYLFHEYTMIWLPFDIMADKLRL